MLRRKDQHEVSLRRRTAIWVVPRRRALVPATGAIATATHPPRQHIAVARGDSAAIARNHAQNARHRVPCRASFAIDEPLQFCSCQSPSFTVAPFATPKTSYTARAFCNRGGAGAAHDDGAGHNPRAAAQAWHAAHFRQSRVARSTFFRDFPDDFCSARAAGSRVVGMASGSRRPRASCTVQSYIRRRRGPRDGPNLHVLSNAPWSSPQGAARRAALEPSCSPRKRPSCPSDVKCDRPARAAYVPRAIERAWHLAIHRARTTFRLPTIGYCVAGRAYVARGVAVHRADGGGTLDASAAPAQREARFVVGAAVDLICVDARALAECMRLCGQPPDWAFLFPETSRRRLPAGIPPADCSASRPRRAGRPCQVLLSAEGSGYVRPARCFPAHEDADWAGHRRRHAIIAASRTLRELCASSRTTLRARSPDVNACAASVAIRSPTRCCCRAAALRAPDSITSRKHPRPRTHARSPAHPASATFYTCSSGARTCAAAAVVCAGTP